MKSILFLNISALLLNSGIASAQSIVRAHDGNIQSVSCKYINTVGKGIYTIAGVRYTDPDCSAAENYLKQAVRGELQTQEACIKSEECEGYRCYRTYGFITEKSIAILYVDDAKRVTDSEMIVTKSCK